MTDKNLDKKISSQEALAGYLMGDDEALDFATISSGLLTDSVVRLLAQDTAFLSVSAQATDAELGELWESLRHITFGDLAVLAGVDPMMIPKYRLGWYFFLWRLSHETAMTISMTEFAMDLATQAFGLPVWFSRWWRNADPNRYRTDLEGEIRRDFWSAVWVARLDSPAGHLVAEARTDKFKLLLYGMKFPPDVKRGFLQNFAFGSPGWRAYARYAIEANHPKLPVSKEVISFREYQKRAERWAERLEEDPVALDYESDLGRLMSGELELEQDLEQLIDDHFGNG